MKVSVISFVLFVLSIFIVWKAYEAIYYRSKEFFSIKNSMQTYISNYNELSTYIQELKNAYLNINKLNYERSSFVNTRKYRRKRKKMKNQFYASNVYNCSRIVYGNAKNQPFKYVCKYFNIEGNEKNLSKFEKILNNFETIEQGKIILKKEKQHIINNITKQVPFLIKGLSKEKLEKKLGFIKIDFSTSYFPRYIFKYVSPGGNTSMKYTIIMNIAGLNNLILHLNQTARTKKNINEQRALMTSTFRKKILQRDRYTCKKCGNSIQNEPSLLLEVNHITPISKGGLTIESNLQTICWKCNKAKNSETKTINHEKNVMDNFNFQDKEVTKEVINPNINISNFEDMNGWEFEEFCANILKKIGYENITVTKGSGDQGVDILAERDGVKYAVQCKKYSQPVGNLAVQQIYSGKNFYHCHVGAIITNNCFTKSAKELAKENGIVLWDKDFLYKYIDSNIENENYNTD